ncbi:homeodomain-like superfamily protein [Actinidia rufa]|uniref:Homeodomain-like superfamily protein n=1 Tax=Actinidia rufa TaxID=165716 RepID=A0A7J0EK02_9ERIC|nr:homeodomain-like superfamily protein [Actinidia rufa]
MTHRNFTSRDQPHTTIDLRRSPRLLPKNHTPPEDPKTPEPKSKRVTSSSSRGKADECVKKISNRCDGFVESDSIEVSDGEDLLGVGRAKVGSNSFKSFGGELGKRTTRASGVNKGKCNGFIKSASRGFFYEEDFQDEERAKVGASRKFGGKLEKRTMCSYGDSPMVIDEGKEMEDRDFDKRMKEIGAKRKRNEVVDGCGFDKGWTKDQELALQRAYYAAKPTPNFWKKVAKLVPGKSAKDCFDKVHADNLTPPQPRTRLRPRQINSSSFSLLASTLLKPVETKTRRPNAPKQRSHLVQKTVRQLLQKHYNVNQSYEADLFSVLESTFNQSTQALQQGMIHSTPECDQGKPGQLKKCHEKSSSVHKKHVSRLSSSYGATLVSPSVLKQVKNKALHEKYIDQLHSRDAKRRAASAQATKAIPGKENRKESYVQKMDSVKAAKDALVFDAKDVIHQFQHVKVSPMSNYSDFDDDGVEMNDDEFER